MTRALTHRGPDDEGFFEGDRVSLGFRRLSVIDLETGAQPIVDEERSLAIILNGEIYNFRELRRELEGKGHQFRSTGDALAVWDGRRHELYLARDRFGIKPLYLCRNGDGLAFASELRSLRAGGFPEAPRHDVLQLRHYLAYGYLSPEGGPFESVRSLPPATILTVDAEGRERFSAYWSPPAPGEPCSVPDQVVDHTREVLENSVGRQLVADVPVGVFLSGGLDSSTVSALARRKVSGLLQTFSVGFEGPDAISELPAAREIALYLDQRSPRADDGSRGGGPGPRADPRWPRYAAGRSDRDPHLVYVTPRP